MGHVSAMGPATLLPEIFVTFTVAASPRPTASVTASHAFCDRDSVTFPAAPPAKYPL
ncbi:MAG: hypothetical protein ACRENE_06610 [Polyangiaceae bacterium]